MIVILKSEINDYKNKIKAHESKFSDYAIEFLESDEGIIQLNQMIEHLEKKCNIQKHLIKLKVRFEFSKNNFKVKAFDSIYNETSKQKSRTELKTQLSSFKDEVFILNCSIDEFKTEVIFLFRAR